MNRGLRKELSVLAGLAAVGLSFGRNKNMAAALGLGAMALRFLPMQETSFNGSSVVITGGSRGLGLALAEEFTRHGAKVTLLARDAEELDRAKEILNRIPFAEVLTVPCDVTLPTQLEDAIQQAQSYFGQIDVLVNCAGSIAVGPYDTMEMADFDSQLALQLDAVVRAVNLVLPSFRRLGGGHIINISSIGGQIPVPHMTTYCAGKFALAGLSETLSAELAPENIKVTTVYPGMMHTGSPIQAVFKGDHEKEYAWFATGNTLPVISVSAEEAARRIIEGARNGDTQVVFPVTTRLAILGHALFPETYAFVARNAARIMPKGDSHTRRTGAESQQWIEQQAWYQPFRRIEESAEHDLNQREKTDAEFNLGVRA